MFSRTPDPQQAAYLFDRLCDAGLPRNIPEGSALARVAHIVCTQTPYLAELAARDCRRLIDAASDPTLRREKPRAVMAAELAPLLTGVDAEADLNAVLRAFRAREYIRLGAREFGGFGDPHEVWRELAHLAEVCLDAAIDFHERELQTEFGTPEGDGQRARFVVMGMGKLGGEELNFASDIDVIYFYSTDRGQTTTGLSLHEYYDKLARRITRAIGEVTDDGAVFRVDLRLRPEGTKGPLVNSLPSAERYYEAWGRPWERQAWLKARPVAGDIELGEQILSVLEPFIYPRHTGPDVVREIESMNRKIKASLDTGSIQSGFDVKLGLGGIREIEFFVQALQMLHAGKQPGLRERSTLGALDRLLYAGLLSAIEWQHLHDAYDFLRRVEHLLQLTAGQQTHRMPSDVTHLAVLAQRLGCADAGELAGLLDQHTSQVAAIFSTLGGSDKSLSPPIATLLDSDAGPESITDALSELGWRDPEGAAFELNLLRTKPLSPFARSAQGPAARVAPLLLQELSGSPDPDQGLRFLVDLVAKRASPSGLWRMFADNAPLTRLVASLFGTSAFLSKTFVDRPELVDTLLLVGRGGPRGDRAQLEAAVDARLSATRDEGEEATWNAVRRVKSEELLRIGLADVAGELDQADVQQQLTALADVCTARMFATVHAAVTERYGPLAPMSVVALGKLGGGEMGYASDLDLIFIYDGDVAAGEAISKLAQRLVNALGATLEDGRLYEVDTRLRPSGNQGTLVSSLTGWRHYQQSRADLWERQALIKARPIAGDVALCLRVAQEIHTQTYRPLGEGDGERIRQAIVSMRERIEKERSKEGDLKTAPGGLIDIEFAIQYLQLRYGAELPVLHQRSTLAALDAARQVGLIDELAHTTLTTGYRFLRFLEQRMRIVHDRPTHELPSDSLELDKLARRTGYSSGGSLARAFHTFTRDVRACYLQLLRP